MLQLPRFSVLKMNYPSKAKLTTKQLLDSIGGQVRGSLRDNVNTCGLRMSLCLNRSGAPILRAPGLYELTGARPSSHPRAEAGTPLFIPRVRDVKQYLARFYGPGRPIYDARLDPMRIELGGRKHVQGIVVFEWLGPPREFGATGHVDLFSVMERGGTMPLFTPVCEGTCYWLRDAGPMTAELWEARP